jgi:hypothetical protein
MLEPLPRGNQPTNPIERIPQNISNTYTAKDWKLLSTITLKNKQKVSTDTFLSVKNLSAGSGRSVVRVKNIWGVGGCVLRQTKLEVSNCSLGVVDEFYGMRGIKVTENVLWINPEVRI